MRLSVHRITEWFELKGTLKIVQFQTPVFIRAQLPLMVGFD